MKYSRAVIACCCLLCLMLLGMPAHAEAISPADAYAILEGWMGMDYGAMSISAFNEVVKRDCEAAGYALDAVLKSALEGIALDDAVYPFILGVMNHSASEIDGTPFTFGVAVKMETAAIPADKMGEAVDLNDYNAWMLYMQQHFDELSFICNLYYWVEYEVPDADQVTIALREEKLSAVRAAVQTFVNTLDKRALEQEDIGERMTVALEEIAREMSDDVWAFIPHYEDLEIYGK